MLQLENKEKDAKAQEAWEAERQAEEWRKEKAEDMRLAWEKLISKRAEGEVLG